MGDRHTFLEEPARTPETEALYAEDVASDGYVWNATRLWSWRPDFQAAFGECRSALVEPSALTDREKAILNTAAAASREDSYCSLAWGPRLAALTDDETAADVIAARPSSALSKREAALADWARVVARAPNATTAADVERLRAAGIDDREIFEATAFVALRVAFTVINGALGASPDLALVEAAPEPIRTAVDYGRAAAPK
jgi:uncharacterized peroxidase-related enzyme